MIKAFIFFLFLCLPVFLFWQYTLYKTVPTTKEYGRAVKGICTDTSTCAFGTFCEPVILKQEDNVELELKPKTTVNVCVPYTYKTFKNLNL